MKQVLIRQGQAVTEEVPAPLVEPGTVLVRVSHSCISVGTEMSGLRNSNLPLWKRALKNPEKVKRVFELVASQGLSRTKSQIEGKMAAGDPTGYSAAGEVIAVGEGVDDLFVGDRVACAGAQCAHHAEVIRVPRNLAVPIPDSLGYPEACSVTLGAIALQGVRRAQPTLGETFVVVGLGILGQLTVQFLKANGCRVIGSDLDPSRLQTGLANGMDLALDPDTSKLPDQVARLTDGLGADGVIITAATPSNEVVSQAFRMCRRKGRVVLVGDVGLDLNRADFYAKEIDFLISTSYGPGRYDRQYEEKGLDYPAAYVRWTENRNMGEYLRLLDEKRVGLDKLIEATYPVDRAGEAYAALKKPGPKPLMVLLSYPGFDQREEPVRTVANPYAAAAGKGAIKLALVGAGGFAKGMHLPNLKALKEKFHLRAVVSHTGHNASATARQFGADYATTEWTKILEDKEVEAVLIATRHNLHASLALAALKAGKHVLVEKPLGLSEEELQGIEAFYAGDEKGKPVLLIGFNRRFSKYVVEAQRLVSKRTNPLMIDYRMNAGYIPLDHWVHGSEGGGRNIGEACHLYDLFTFLTGSKVVTVTALSIKPTTGHYSPKDNFTASMSFEDGSTASLTYSALGEKAFPKERMDLHFDGKTIVLDDYKKLEVHGAKSKKLESATPSKGQLEELEAFANAIRKGGDWPIPLWQQLQASRIALEVESKF